MLAPLGQLVQRFVFIGVGAVVLFIGAAMLTQYIARPLARIIGAPMAKVGLAGRLGQENAMRNPSRTAQTAAALTIGVALVTGVTVFAASLQETFIGTLDKRVRADLVILSSSQQPFSPAAAAQLKKAPELANVTAWRDGEFKDANGNNQGVSGVDPAQLQAMYDPGLTSGSIASLSLPGSIAVQKDYANDHDLTVGSTIRVIFAKTGRVPLTVTGIFTDDTLRPVLHLPARLRELLRHPAGHGDPGARPPRGSPPSRRRRSRSAS